MSERDAVRRHVNLVFALLGSDRPRSTEWVRANVDGYDGNSASAFQIMLKRDVKELRSMWVPIQLEDGELWLNKDQYELQPVELTEAEATVVGLAADLAQGANLGAFARSGWTKLAASGATRAFDAPVLASVSNDITRLDPETLRKLVAGVRNKLRLKFDFLPAPGAQVQRRTVDPWGIVPLNNRAYLVGWDLDRGQERVFRVRKISNVAGVQGADGFREASGDLQGIVEKQLSSKLVDATVTLTPGTGDALASRGKRDGDTIQLSGVDRDWLVRTIAAQAPNVTAVEPEEVRRDVVALLSRVGGQE
ncbi:WYL domain-containing protein [Corynebacterium sp. Q4381]|uniref:helix-turn-helix transcriptional regulator n=1 Tax=Corynebacterium sp. Marseille-Q4381 TaxID=3121597 RepID=UPI002FE4FFF3